MILRHETCTVQGDNVYTDVKKHEAFGSWIFKAHEVKFWQQLRRW